MHPTMIAMVAAEREIAIARAALRRTYDDVASAPQLFGTPPLTHSSRGVGPTQALASMRAALTRLVSRPIFSPRTTAGREVCCA